MSKVFRAWIGCANGRPLSYLSPYYERVLHGDLFKTKRAALECYEDVRRVTITVEEKATPKRRRA